MKLDVAAANVDRDRVEGNPKHRLGVTGLIVATVFVFCLLVAGSSMALDGIDLSEPAEPTAEGECPKLIQIKYPFLACSNGQIGLSDADETWENTRQIPFASDFVEGNGYFGWELNRD